MRRLLPFLTLAIASLPARSIEPPQPPALEPAYAHAPLPATQQTLLRARANAPGGRQAVVAPGPDAGSIAGAELDGLRFPRAPGAAGLRLVHSAPTATHRVSGVPGSDPTPETRTTDR